MKHIFIVNPAAGKGESMSVYLPRILKRFSDAGVEYEIHRTLNAADVSAWSKKRAEAGDEVRFYACGGDGTINDVASSLVGRPNAQLAAIPCGSGNDFVRNFTHKENFLSLDRLINGTVCDIDVISYGDQFAVNMCNIGADCDVVIRASELKGKLNGAAIYMAAALEVLPKGPKYHLSYTIDGVETEEDCLLMAVGNGAYCGGGFYACPKANLVDGKMDICIAGPVKGARLLATLLKYKAGEHVDNPKLADLIKYVQVDSFKLKAMEPVHICKDGETSLFEEAEFKVLPRALKFVIPAGSELIKK